jgi:hypothetical protein
MGMQVFYYDTVTGACLGSFGPGTILPPNAAAVSVVPVDGRQIWSGNGWNWPPEVIRARTVAAIADCYQAALAAGLSYDGKTLQICEQDQANLTAMGNEARWAKVSAATWPSNFAWRMADDSFLSLPDPDAMIALAEAAKTEVVRLRQVKWGHVDAVRGLASSAEIAAYDYETGW